MTHESWTAAAARSLVCRSDGQRSDAILVENFDPDYLVFERARQLREQGVAARVLVPLASDPGSSTPNPVAVAVTETLTALARLGTFERVPIHQVEPISLNAAREILAYTAREEIHSVVVVSPLFRSRRSMLVYQATLGRAGIRLGCEPVGGLRSVDTWTRTWHGIENFVEQWVKLQYYRWYVLPFRTAARISIPHVPAA